MVIMPVLSRHSQHCLLRLVHFGQHEIRIQCELPLYYNIYHILMKKYCLYFDKKYKCASITKILP